MSLPDLEPVRVGSAHGDLWVVIALNGRVIEDDREEQIPYRVTTQYSYHISEDAERFRQILAYHWTPEVKGDQRTFPHLRVGSAVLQDEYRTELRHFLVRLGVENLLEGDVQEWENFAGLIDQWGGQYPEGFVRPWTT